MDLAPYQAVRNLEEYDSFDDIIIVEDALTHESIFQNKAYREETANYKNANRPSFESRFLSVTSFRKEFAGRNLVVEVATRVRPQSSFPYDGALRTAITKIEEQIRQEIQTDIYEGLAPSKKHHKYLQEVVDITMRYYECPFAHVVLLKGQRQATLAAYAGEGEPGISKVAFESYWDNSQTNFFQYGYSLLLEDMAGFAAFDPPLYEKLKENGVHTVLMIPFFIEARQVGFLLLANPRSKKQGFDLFLGDFAANAIGTLLYHGQLYDSLYYDPLTKLPYSDLLETQFPYLKKHFAGKPIAMMGFDIRHFHTYSRSYGLEKGDELLVHISEILRQRYPKDLIFRKRGTDSFLVFASALAGSLANDAKAIQKEIQSMHPETLLAMSFGIYQISPEEEVFRVIGLKVNFAHKRAKDLRGSGIAVFDDKMAERESYERYLTDHFREGLEKEQFEVFLQPRYNLETSTYFSGEALVRWRRDGKLVPPDDFIPCFEVNGLCHDLDLYILRKVCELQARWMKEGKKDLIPIAVNYSRTDFADPDLFEKTAETLQEYGVPPELLEIEITESACVDFEEQMHVFLAKCHVYGIKVLMDDFGTGESSFASLKDLDVDGLKLDYKFLGESASGRKKRKIIESIVSLARSLRLPLIVEGVEKEDDAAYFKRLGVRYVQGFFFGRPVPVPEFEELTNKQSELFSDHGHDERLMFDEMVDQSSNLHLFLDRMPVATVLSRYDGESLRIIFANRKCSESVSRIGSLKAFLEADLLALLSEEDRRGMKEFLEESKDFYSFTAPRRFAFRRAMNLHQFYLCLMKVKEEGGVSYYLIRGSQRASDQALLTPKPSYTAESFRKSVAFGSRNYAIFSEDGMLVEKSPGVESVFPNLKLGLSASKIFGEEAKNLGTVSRFYSFQEGHLVQIEFNPMILDGEAITVASFAPLADDQLRLTFNAKQGYGFFERALNSLGIVVSHYTEVDLEEDRYFQVRLSKDGTEEKVYQQGSYSRDYLPSLLKRIARDEADAVAFRISLPSLKEGYLSRTPFEVSYGEKDGEKYFRMRVSYQFDHGHRYACFFLEDISDLRKKDFDPLTGLFARRAGRMTMERYIKEHPLAKMAFVLFDIDHFKKFNDTYGHPLGDKVLSALKGELEKLPEEYAYFTRFGGDEFTLLIKDRGAGFSLSSVRESLDHCLNEVGKKVGLQERIGASCGVSLIPEDGSSVSEVYVQADNSLYEHKAQKRGK